MRRRDMQQFNPTPEWQQRSTAAQQAVRNGSKKPDDFSEIWRELKPDLAKLSFGKCWYCESRQVRADNAVDHYRPKSNYPWYAFSFDNFRFACSFCNSPHRNPKTGKAQGKSNFFPLFDNSPQASSEAEIDLEQPILLDPCNPLDPGLLDFKSDGSPCPRFADNPIFVKRVVESIRLYHLDHPDLVEQRRLLGRKIEGWIKAADRLYKKVLERDLDAEQAFVVLVGNLGQAIDDRAELSVFARRIVSAHRSKSWIDAILDT